MTIENEKKREWLMRYLWAKRRANEEADELDAIMLSGARAITYDPTPHGPSTPHGLETLAVRADEQLAAERKARERVWTVRAEINAALDELSESHAQVLRYRYLTHAASPYEKKCGRFPTVVLSWQEIAERCYLSVDRVTHLHGEALVNLTVRDRQ